MDKLIYIGIILLIFILSFGIVACNDGLGDGSGDDSGVCGICGGDGFVTSKFLGEGSGVQKGFDTYYRCKGCHGSGKS